MRIRLAYISIRAALTLSVAAALVCCGYLLDGDVRLFFIDSFAARADLIGFPVEFLVAAGILIIINLPVAIAGKFVLVLLGAVAPSLGTFYRMTIVGIVVLGVDIFWWRMLLRVSSGAVTTVKNG